VQNLRVLAIHDISGVGRCSLTVALPVLSAAGIECAVLPTAVLSTHTGEFEGYTFRDLTEDIVPMAEHWASLGLRFDAIYTGYLGSFEQVELVKQVIQKLNSENTLVVVDPVMADEGELYPGFSKDYPAQMHTLCALADVIVPNVTEAALLLGRDYNASPDATDVESLLQDLCSDTGAKASVLTGVSFESGQLGAASYDGAGSSLSYAGAPFTYGMYHGSGDLFSSALVAGLMRGQTLAHSVEQAVTFTAQSIQRTYAAGTETKYGLLFEAGLAEFGMQLQQATKVTYE